MGFTLSLAVSWKAEVQWNWFRNILLKFWRVVFFLHIMMFRHAPPFLSALYLCCNVRCTSQYIKVPVYGSRNQSSCCSAIDCSGGSSRAMVPRIFGKRAPAPSVAYVLSITPLMYLGTLDIMLSSIYLLAFHLFITPMLSVALSQSLSWPANFKLLTLPRAYPGFPHLSSPVSWTPSRVNLKVTPSCSSYLHSIND